VKYTNVNCMFSDRFININCCNMCIHIIVCFKCSGVFKVVTKQVLA